MSRILAIDYGDKRTGIAISDELKITSRPLETILASTDAELTKQIINITEQYDIDLILIGMPYLDDGRIGPQSQKVQSFVSQLTKSTSIPIEYIDETYSSKLAEDLLAADSKQAKSQLPKALVDSKAAQIILSTYLNQ